MIHKLLRIELSKKTNMKTLKLILTLYILFIFFSTISAQRLDFCNSECQNNVIQTMDVYDCLDKEQEGSRHVKNIINELALLMDWNSYEDIKVIACSGHANCTATYDYGGRKTIIYDPAYLKITPSFGVESVNQLETDIKDWRIIGVLAHELAHLHKGDLKSSANIQYEERIAIELEADFYAGQMLALSGASLEDVKTVGNSFMEEACGHHPKRTDRLNSLMRGWLRINPNRDIVIPDSDSNLDIPSYEIPNLSEKRELNIEIDYLWTDLQAPINFQFATIDLKKDVEEQLLQPKWITFYEFDPQIEYEYENSENAKVFESFSIDFLEKQYQEALNDLQDNKSQYPIKMDNPLESKYTNEELWSIMREKRFFEKQNYNSFVSEYDVLYQESLEYNKKQFPNHPERVWHSFTRRAIDDIKEEMRKAYPSYFVQNPYVDTDGYMSYKSAMYKLKRNYQDYKVLFNQGALFLKYPESTLFDNDLQGVSSAVIIIKQLEGKKNFDVTLSPNEILIVTFESDSGRKGNFLFLNQDTNKLNVNESQIKKYNPGDVIYSLKKLEKE